MKTCSFPGSISCPVEKPLSSRQLKAGMLTPCSPSVGCSIKGSATHQILLKPTSGTLWARGFWTTIAVARDWLMLPPIRRDWRLKYPTIESSRMDLYMEEQRIGSPRIGQVFLRGMIRILTFDDDLEYLDDEQDEMDEDV